MKTVCFRPVNYRMTIERFIRRDMEVSTVLGKETTVDIILPVTESLQKIVRTMEMIDRTNVGYHMVFLNDGLKNEEVRSFLSQYAEQHRGTKIVDNDAPIGIVSSVNRGLVITRSEWIVLLGGDVILPEYWLERLIMPLIKDPSVASVTPFTNDNELTGFPLPGEADPLFMEEDPAHLDELFQSVRSIYSSIEYGSAFCMAINREAVHKIGVLNQQEFKKLKGADVEWSKRAAEAGYRHVVVENLYVRQPGPMGDQPEENSERSSDNEKTNDPLAEIRAYIFCRLAAEKSSRRRIALHQFGASISADLAVSRYLDEKMADGEAIMTVSFDRKNGWYHVRFEYREHLVEFIMSSMDEVLELAAAVKIRRIIVGRIIGFPMIHDTLAAIRILSEEQGARLVVMLMDYFPICPAGTLFSSRKEVCDTQNGGCQNCRISGTEADNSGFTDIFIWRQMWKELLGYAQEVRYYSPAVLKMMEAHFGRLEKVHQMTAPVTGIRPVTEMKQHEDTRVLIMGTMDRAGGVDYVRDLVKCAEKGRVPIQFYLLNEGKEEKRGKIHSLHLTRLKVKEGQRLQDLVREEQIDMILLPELVPDAIGMRAKTAIELDIPAACRSGGASEEQIRWYGKGKILSEDAVKAIEELCKLSEEYRMSQKENFPRGKNRKKHNR